VRLPGLLGHVDRVLEADQRVEGQRGAADDQQRDRLALAELEVAGEVAAAVGQERRADHHDEHEPAQLDQRAADVEAHRLPDAAEVDQRDREHERDADEDGRQLDERRQVVAAERGGERAGGRHAGAHHREGDHEGEERLAVGAMHVERGARGARVLCDELGVGGGGEQREHPREAERGPDRPPTSPPTSPTSA